MSKDKLISVFWCLIPISVLIFLTDEGGGAQFLEMSRSHPLLMGFIKFFILATLGELLGRRLALKKWQFFGISLFHRALIWGMFGYAFAFVFPLFSAGVDEIIKLGLLYMPEPGPGASIMRAFWRSFFINMIFAFPFMTLHKITDTLIDQKRLFSRWPFITIWKELDWDTHLKKVAPTIIWFWIPAHTLTFSLAPEYRLLLAAYLGIVLGVILPFFNAKRTS